MKIQKDPGLLLAARQLASPNQDQRPSNTPIDLIVIHGISLPPGEFGGLWIDALFSNSLEPQIHPYFREIANLRVSSHLLIRRDGEIVQYVPFQQRAWHAGQSCFAGRERCNDFAIGIELEGTDTLAYTDPQYRQLSRVIPVLMQTYPAITKDRIVGHEHIAPGRKTDPGRAFDWERLWDLLSLIEECH